MTHCGLDWTGSIWCRISESFEYTNERSGSITYGVISKCVPFQTNSITVWNAFEVLWRVRNINLVFTPRNFFIGETIKSLDRHMRIKYVWVSIFKKYTSVFVNSVAVSVCLGWGHQYRMIITFVCTSNSVNTLRRQHMQGCGVGVVESESEGIFRWSWSL
jgi:hypothetical protein